MITTRPYEPEFKLTEAEKQRVLLEIYSRIGRISPREVTVAQLSAGGGLLDLERHLDEIVDVVHRSTADHIEPYLLQFHEEVCTRCPHQEPSLYCPLRSAAECALFRHPRTVVSAVRDALREIELARGAS